MPTITEWLECKGLPVEQCRKFQRRHGKPLSPLTVVAVDHQPPKRTCGKTPHKTDGPGAELLAMHAAAGVPACQACRELAGRMNDWGPDGCAERLEQIVGEITPRAKKWFAENKPWIHKLLPNVVEESGIRFVIRRDVLAAIEAARAKL